MPFPNEHAARLQDPKRFDRFRRISGGKIFGGKLEVPKTIGIIWGHIKEGPPNAWAVQALRFPTKDWKEADAKKWLKDNKITPMTFEPAVKKTKKEILGVHKALHSICELDDISIQLFGLSRDSIYHYHSEIISAMDDSGIAHASIMPISKIEKEDEDELKDMQEHILDEATEDLVPIQEDGAIDEGLLSITTPIIKVDEGERIVYGIVLEPNVVDTQGDMISEEEIAKAAHYFMEKAQTIGYQHKDFKKKFNIMESYIAPVAFNFCGQEVRKGTWLLSVRVVDDGVWKEVKKGEITGFSIGGVGTRVRRS